MPIARSMLCFAGRALTCGLLALLTTTTAAAAEATTSLLHADRIVFRGLTQLDSQQFALTLVANDELLLLSSPLTSRKTFLTAVTDRATLALQREGFAAAKATASIEHGENGPRVIIDVVEGPRGDSRFRCRCENASR